MLGVPYQDEIRRLFSSGARLAKALGAEVYKQKTASRPRKALVVKPVIGVRVCDEYLAKYRRCARDKIPKEQADLMQQSIKTMSEAWKKAARTRAGKRALRKACTTATETASKSMAAFKCEW